MEKRLPVFSKKYLGLWNPWSFSDVEQKRSKVHIHVDFKRGVRFACKCELCSVLDTIIRHWRHINLFQYKTYLHANIQRINTPDGVEQVQVPYSPSWAGRFFHQWIRLCKKTNQNAEGCPSDFDSSERHYDLFHLPCDQRRDDLFGLRGTQVRGIRVDITVFLPI